MRNKKYFCMSFVAAVMLIFMCQTALADVTPGDVIDKSNWEKVEGLLPESIVNWVKKGDYILNIGSLNYDPLEYNRFLTAESLKKNIGKYELDETDNIIDIKTGKLPDFIAGIPFPEVDDKDPGAATKIAYNRSYYQALQGHISMPYQVIFVGRKGREREVDALWVQITLDGFEGAKDIPNPDAYMRRVISLFLQPFDVAGTAQMAWRFRAAKSDLNFAYLPSMRRVRRTTPANRSDGIVGSDICYDDAWGYDGKVSDFKWKLIREQEALLPFRDKNPITIVQNKNGGWETTKDIKDTKFGFETKGWTGVPWAPTNCIWVKRTVQVMELRSRNPYYNFGIQYIWLDKESQTGLLKIVCDRAGDYWKTMILGQGGLISKDKESMKLLTFTLQQNIDERSDHCSIIKDCSKRNKWIFFHTMDVNSFTLGGFPAFCK
ncbi:MAG: DUF1329 domain-containing protein [Dissulfuribacterales bacterium]